ncbi:MAG: DUF3303 domain-containing protein [Chloroflexota bacterium]
MKYIMKVRMSKEGGNNNLRDPEFGKKMQEALAEVNAEAAYFTTIDGNRGGYIIVNMDNASQMAAFAEPFFHWMDAEIEFLPVMTPEDLAKAAPAIEKAVRKWGAYSERYSGVNA